LSFEEAEFSLLHGLGDYAASDYGMTADSNPSFEDETLLLRGIPETSSRADNGYITAWSFSNSFRKTGFPSKNPILRLICLPHLFHTAE